MSATRAWAGWPVGGGEAGALVRATDWSRTPLGPIAAWPQSLRTAVDIVLNSPVAMVLMWGPAHVMIYNDGYVPIAADKHPAALGGTVPAIWPEIWDWNRAILAAGFAGEARLYSDQPLRLSRGGMIEDVWFDLSYTPVRDESGAVRGVLCIAPVITDRVLAEQRQRAVEAELRDANERIGLALDAGAVIGTWVWEIGPNRLTGDERFAMAFGVDPAQAARGLPLERFVDSIHPDDRAGVLEFIEAAMRRGGSYRAEYRARHADGAYRWIEAAGRVETDAEGRPVRFPGVLIDIEERRRADELLRRSERRHAFLLAITDRLREPGSTIAILNGVSEMLGRWFGVNRVGYGHLDPERDLFHFDVCWDDGSIPTLLGSFPAAAFGPQVVARLQAGATVVVADIMEDPLTGEEGTRATARAVDTRAILVVPLVKAGQLRTIVYLNARQPRAWTVGEVELMEEVAERTRELIERTRIEEASRKLAERLRLAQEAAGVGAFTVDIAESSVHATDEFCRIFGLEPAAAIAAEVLEALILPEDRDAASRDETRVAGVAVLATEYRIQRADTGELRWISRRAEYVRDANGRPLQLIGVVQDITDRKRAEEALRRFAQDLEREVAARTAERDRIWRVSQDLLTVADGQGTLLSVNPAWTDTLGWGEAELVGRTTQWLEHPDDHMTTRAEIAQLAAGNRTHAFENRLRARDGSYRWISWKAVPEGGLLYCFGTDVTSAKQAQEALARTEEALRQAQKMEAIGQLTGGIAHDFNNLLTGIIGSLELLQRRIRSGRLGDLERFAEAAVASANRAAGLTHRLLAFSRRQSLDPRPLSVNDLVRSMADLLRRTLGENIALDFMLAPDLWIAEVDANQLESALLNLVINARDAMPDGGILTIGTANETVAASLDGNGPEAGQPEAGDYVALRVADTGTGMPQSVIDRAFEPFYTTKPVGQGTGLGLSMVYGFAKQSNGHASISSSVGEGTVVTLLLPRHHGAGASADVPAELIQTGAGERILLVEDDPAVRMLVVDVLREIGYDAIEVADGNAAIPVLDRERHLDLLITDVGLPGMNGRQVAEIARQKHPDVKVLFISGYAEAAVQRSGFLAPGMELIAKPFALDALAARIRAMLGS